MRVVGWDAAATGWSLMVHGGAGQAHPASHAELEAGCRRAASLGAELLSQGGRACDAVEHAVRCLEDDPRFNAGTGASLNAAGHLELDASIMDGRSLKAGAVCVLAPFRHPVSVARAVLDEGRHVLYAGEGAKAFARRSGFEVVDEAEMIQEAARERWRRALRVGGARAEDTVGAVAMDGKGHFAAATSTGGLTAKLPGRVGDSPLIGAGNYADDRLGALSATGDGEGIIRVGLALSTLLEIRNDGQVQSSTVAVRQLEEMHLRTGAVGGLIIALPGSKLVWARSAAAMPWAAIWQGSSGQGGC